MNDTTTTKSYAGLAGESYGAFVDAAAVSNQRALGLVKSWFEIVSRPYSSTAIEHASRENLDRVNQIVELTIGAMQKNGTDAAKLSETLAGQGARLGETAVESMRGAMRTGLSNLTFVKETVERQYAGFAQHVEDVQSKATAP